MLLSLIKIIFVNIIIRIDVIEAQWAMISVHFLTAIFGQNVWHLKVYQDVTLLHVLFVLTTLALSRSLLFNTILIFGGKTPLDSYVKIPRKADKNKWNPFISITIIVLIGIYLFLFGVFTLNSILFTFNFGLAIAKLAFKLQASICLLILHKFSIF